MAEAIHFEFDKDMAFQNTVVENQVHKKMFAANRQSLLSPFKTKFVTELQQKLLQVPG